MRVPAALRARFAALAREAQQRGTALYFVGGCVRDWLLGRRTLDIDLVVEGESAPLARAAVRLWGGRLQEFDRFGTVRVALDDGLHVDFARARQETYERPAALPRVRPASISEDLVRRDFTVNALALRVLASSGGRASLQEELLDLHGGLEDLKARRLRVLHDKSFEDDPTRLLRAARYAARFGLEPEPGTARLIQKAAAAGLLGLLSRERVRRELWRTLEEEEPGAAMALLKEWGLLGVFHPRFRWEPRAARGTGPALRLGLCALAMGEEGEEFLRSLRLERGLAQALCAALKLAREERAPLKPLPELAQKLLRAGIEGLPRVATQPLLLGGADLQRSGRTPGKEFSRLLGEAARAQWRAEFTTREAALRWLARQPLGGSDF